MTCGTCGATIADKAIICYRCGAPTEAPAPRAQKAARRRRPWGILVSGIVAVGLGGLGSTFPFESPEQIVSLTGAAGALVAGGLLWLRGRR